jgi:hypothetical protein
VVELGKASGGLSAGSGEAGPNGADEVAPVDLDLAEARAAFARGDFRETRRRASALAARSELPEAVHQEADQLLAATGNDSLAIALGIGCLVFFLAIVLSTLGR